jgi:hypothetical protein
LKQQYVDSKEIGIKMALRTIKNIYTIIFLEKRKSTILKHQFLLHTGQSLLRQRVKVKGWLIKMLKPDVHI